MFKNDNDTGDKHSTFLARKYFPICQMYHLIGQSLLRKPVFHINHSFSGVDKVLLLLLLLSLFHRRCRRHEWWTENREYFRSFWKNNENSENFARIMSLRKTGSRRQYEVKDLTTPSHYKQKLQFPVSLFKREMSTILLCFGTCVCFFRR
jgi:hypothetical protein